jgi:multiple sugar transport system ATP-binding protein
MVFQSYALYPQMTVAQNMAFALKMAGVRKAERERRVQAAATLLDLQPLLNRKPKALSGGQRQRVAMGRAIVREPQVFLMDEPLSNLDAKLRVQTRTHIAALQRKLGVTTVYVTHDQVEAMTMGDRVAVLCDGVLQQCGTPLALYDRPGNVFVAEFIGSPSMNLMCCRVTDAAAELGGIRIPLARRTLEALGAAGEDTVLVGLRPEALRLVGDDEEGLAVTVGLIEELGSDAFLYGSLRGPDAALYPHGAELVARIDPRDPPATGKPVRLHIDPSRVHTFSTRTGDRLPE